MMNALSMERLNGMRHVGIHDPARYEDKRVAIIGVGTIGSWLAHILARMQVAMTLYDHDQVEEHNLATQTYGANDIDRNKVDAVAEQLYAINPWLLEDGPHMLKAVAGEFAITDATVTYDLIVSAVDSLEARRGIAQMLIDAGIPTAIVDGRVGREQVEVYYFENATAWLAQLPETGDTDPCGARFTAYAAVEAAGFMANNIKRHLMGQRLFASRIIFDNASMTFLTEK